MQKAARLLIIISLLYSCAKKDSPEIPNPAEAPAISAVPAHFSQNMLIEAFTSSGCGTCPKMHLTLDSLVNANPGRVFGTEIHVTDLLIDSGITDMLTGKNSIDTLFNTGGIYPSGMVNRVNLSVSDLSPDFWAEKVSSGIGNVPRGGLAIDARSITGPTLTLTVHCGFNTTVAGDYHLHVYLVQRLFQTQDSTYIQLNDYSEFGPSPDTSSSLYDLDYMIYQYPNRYVLRRVISANGVNGDPIPPGDMVAHGQYVKNYSVNVSGLNLSNYLIVAFVDKHGPTGPAHRIENVQQVEVGQVRDWN